MIAQLRLDDAPPSHYPVGAMRALVALCEQALEHGFRGGNTFDATWLEAYGRCSRSDAYRLGKVIRCLTDSDADKHCTARWTNSDGDAFTMGIAYSRGSFRVWGIEP